MHIESTLLCPPEFARLAARHGTGTVICDPHEIANVHGVQGIRYMLDSTASLPVAVFIMLPSCVPSSHLETAGASIGARELEILFSCFPDRILGLAEMMNVPGVLNRDPQVMDILQTARGKIIDGHCPGLSGQSLDAYILAGPSSDHESVSLEEAREKLRKGMHVMVREGSSEKNLTDLLPLIEAGSAANISLVTDDRHADDLLSHGHLDHTLRLAIEQGLDPVLAISTATISTARRFGLHDRGAIAPGYRADFLLLNSLESIDIDQVYLGGQLLEAEDFQIGPGSALPSTIRLPQLSSASFSCPDPRSHPEQQIKAITIVPGQILTRSQPVSPPGRNGCLLADPEQDLAKLAVIERHTGSGRIGLGFVQGLGLRTGAVASTVAHDSHNCLVAGVHDGDMLQAAQTLATMGGGYAVVSDGRLLASLPLPLAGLMSVRPAEQVVTQLRRLNQAVAELGSSPELNLFMTLSFLALPVIPELRLTDLGLVDVDRFELTSLLWPQQEPPA
jgi:adenine deaminase